MSVILLKGCGRMFGKKNVLIVDDESSFLLSLAEGLNTYSHRVNALCAENGRKAIEALQMFRVELLVTDITMPEMDGVELLEYVKKYFPEIPVIIITALDAPQVEARLHDMPVAAIMEKPLDFQELADRILRELGIDGKRQEHFLSPRRFFKNKKTAGCPY
jgi:DNA-binding NtrC family response regulator